MGANASQQALRFPEKVKQESCLQARRCWVRVCRPAWLTRAVEGVQGRSRQGSTASFLFLSWWFLWLEAHRTSAPLEGCSCRRGNPAWVTALAGGHSP